MADRGATHCGDQFDGDAGPRLVSFWWIKAGPCVGEAR